MRATFPHMGGAYVAVKGFLEDLGVDVVIPPQCSKRTLEIGIRHSPETACLPLKVNIGNYIESIEMGADTIIITGSCGPCRFGYYGIVEKEILKDIGIDIDIIVFDPPNEGYRAFWNKVVRVTNNRPPHKIMGALYRAYMVASELDNMDKIMFYTRPREIKKGAVKKIYNEYLKNLESIHGTRSIIKLIKETKEKLKSVEINTELIPLKVGIIGEIYTVIEPFVNLYVEEKLGDIGVEVDRSMTVSSWIKTNIFSKAAGINNEKMIDKAAEPYLKNMIGGHARQCIGNAVLYSRRGYDGIIQLLPFSCMPEIVARSILPTLSKNEGIPYMELVVDELTGESGYITRLEAFVDMLEIRREGHIGEILPGH